jgi:hypothetical protein
MRGAIPPLPNTSSWRGVQLSTGTTLPLPYLREVGWKSVDWIHLVQDRYQWRFLVYTVMNLRVP